MERFEDLITSNIPVLVDFFAEWCGPCKTMKPILEELKGIKGEKVRIVKVDVDKHREIAAHYQIQSVPTLMIFKDGKQLWRQSGVMRANDLSTILAQYE
ncbi:thioredoxin [uncultured Phocaeicola sp.]|uniref:thioredoxin n=2 Tax=uncultured Phocaeicola sp. TaxID=990718 RepID=UPI0023D5287A|nr:thioredoxin [uncultured Phocaeicola sp.]MDE6799632.1 thioredoxin [Phocaeicola sp.]